MDIIEVLGIQLITRIAVALFHALTVTDTANHAVVKIVVAGASAQTVTSSPVSAVSATIGGVSDVGQDDAAMAVVFGPAGSLGAIETTTIDGKRTAPIVSAIARAQSSIESLPLLRLCRRSLRKWDLGR
jgi:hypothetical protein